MANRNFWITLFTGVTWEAFNAGGARKLELIGDVVKRTAQVRVGDYLLCCLMGISRFIGVLSVTSDPDIRTGGKHCHIEVKPLILLTPETALPAHELKDCLSCFHVSVHPHAWMTCFCTNMGRWKASDGEHVVSALLKLRQHAVRRPLALARIASRPEALVAGDSLMTVPQYQGESDSDACALKGTPMPTGNHALVQAFFLKLGRKLGFETWIPPYDRFRKIGGRAMGQWPGVTDRIAFSLDKATQQTLSLMDVLWIDREHISSAFMIERDGFFLIELLRIADFLGLKPDCPTAFYLVTPDTRRADIIREINRPVFATMKTPPASVCRFISLSTLHREIPRLKHQLKYLSSVYLLEISESCEPQEFV